MKLGPVQVLWLMCAAVVAGSGCSSGGRRSQPEMQPQNMRPAAAHGAAPQSTADVTAAASPLKFAAQPGWVTEKPSMSMRQAQYRLPRADGDSEDAELVVYYFQGGGGGVQANIDRWIGQFSKPDGSPVSDAKTTHTTANGIPITVVDVTGTYMGGMGSETKSKTNHRMLAAVAEAGGGPWFFKLTGPVKTVSRWEPSFQSFIAGIRQ